MIFNRRFGRFRLIRKLASGGMAEVFVGLREGPYPFARLVALKAMMPHLARDPAHVEMFYREARIGGLLRHPNVIQVFDALEVDGHHTMVMEYAAGQTAEELQVRLDANKEQLPPELALRIVSDAAMGLHHAHELRGLDGIPLQLVHRDVSPQNIMVGYDGVAKVFDFGVAVGGAGADGQGQLAGKAAYMSPEQCRGKHVDRRSDVFSLGIVLHELLTGRRLFKRDNHIASIRAITEEAVPLPSQLRPELPLEIDAIVLKALSRDVDERFASALDFHLALEACLAHDGKVAGRERLASVMGEAFRNEISESQVVVQKILLAPAPSDSTVDLSTIDREVASSGAPGDDAVGEEAPTRVEAAPGDYFQARAEAEIQRKLKGNRNTIVVLSAALVLAAIVAVAAWLRAPATTVVETARGPEFLVLTVDSEPAGAQVLLAGELHPVVTPTSVMVPAGSPTRLEVRSPGYQAYEVQVAPAREGETSRSVMARLEVDPESPEAPIGRLRIVYQPEDAVLLVDRERRAEGSPALIEGLRLNREYQLRLQKTGYRALDVPITLDSGDLLELHLEIEEMVELARLGIDSTPSGAEVRVNGQEAGTTPVELELPSNVTYMVELTRAGFQTVRRPVPLYDNQAINVTLQRVVAAPTPGAPTTAPTPGTRPAPSGEPAPTRPAQQQRPREDDYPLLLD